MNDVSSVYREFNGNIKYLNQGIHGILSFNLIPNQEKINNEYVLSLVREINFNQTLNVKYANLRLSQKHMEVNSSNIFYVYLKSQKKINISTNYLNNLLKVIELENHVLDRIIDNNRLRLDYDNKIASYFNLLLDQERTITFYKNYNFEAMLVIFYKQLLMNICNKNQINEEDIQIMMIELIERNVFDVDTALYLYFVMHDPNGYDLINSFQNSKIKLQVETSKYYNMLIFIFLKMQQLSKKERNESINE